MKDLDYVYNKFENLILFLEAEVNGTDECVEVLEAKKALNALYQIIENWCSMSVNLKVGDMVEILYYEEGISDAPSNCIGKVGKIIYLENDQEPHIYSVEFVYEINCSKSWNFKPEQIKLF